MANRNLVNTIAQGVVGTSGGVVINQPIKDQNINGLVFFMQTATNGAITDAFLRSSYVSIQLNVSKGQNAVVSNNIPLIYFAKLSDYAGGFGDFDNSDIIAFKIDLGMICVRSQDVLSVNVNFGTPTADISYTIFTENNLSTSEKIYEYQMTSLPSGTPTNFDNVLEAYLFFAIDNPTISDSNKISVSDKNGSYMISEVEAVSEGAITGKAEQWQDLGLLFTDKTKFTQAITLSGAGNNEVAIMRKWYFNPYRVENYKQATNDNKAYAAELAKNEPQKYLMLCKYYGVNLNR